MALIKKSKLKKIQEIDQALNELRPHLAVDGGNVEVLDYTDDMTVKIKWLGNCESCSMSAFTLHAGIEQAIKSKFPEVLAVIAVNS
ncbi:MAG: NifU family protein [Saprospiraceae bacterium]|nr:NifU family protein [Saprospiraceae bacterium]